MTAYSVAALEYWASEMLRELGRDDDQDFFVSAVEWHDLLQVHGHKTSPEIQEAVRGLVLTKLQMLDEELEEG